MNEDEFTKYIQGICNYYERRTPKDGTADLWYSRLKGIPAEPLSWVFAKLVESDDFPKNLPGRTWQLYKEWLTAHTEKALFPTTFDCPDCKDEPGLIFVKKFNENTGFKTEYAFNCGRCRQSPYKEWPYALKKDLLEVGYEIVDLLGRSVLGQMKFKKDIKQPLDNVVKIF